MTWTHFTSYLDGSRFITKAERDELYTQLAVQLAACSGALALNSTDQSAITGSGLITALASLDDSSGPTNTRGELHEILEVAGPIWSNYATIVAAALTAEGLTSTTRDEIIDRLPDHHKLWNYYRRVIDGLECASTIICAGGFSNSGFANSGPTGALCLRNNGSPPCDGLAAGQTLYIKFEVFLGTATFKVFIDGVEVYNSGSVTGQTCASYSLATGAEEVQFQVVIGGGSVSWYYSVACTPRPGCP